MIFRAVIPPAKRGKRLMAADWSGALLEWEAELSVLKARIGDAFKRSEVREIAGAFIDGLLSGVERKTGWLMAEQAGVFPRVFTVAPDQEPTLKSLVDGPRQGITRPVVKS
jgi:hypothetical protein